MRRPDQTFKLRIAFLIGVGLLLAGIAFRLLIVSQFSGTSPDGHQYYALSQSLLHEQRLAFAPHPAALTFSRLPGYPLFLAAIARQTLPMSEHLTRAATANVILDALTALAVLLFLRRVGRGAALCSVLMIFVCPLLILSACMQLTESLATALATVEVILCLRAAERGSPVTAVAAGVLAGLGQLVRSDAVTFLPASLLALMLSAAVSPWRMRLRLVAAFVVAATVVYAPWPVRNLRQFGHPHFEATEWLKQDGTPLTTGLIAWMRTWSDATPGQSALADMIVFGRQFSHRTPGVPLPSMFDSEDERERLIALIDTCGSQGFTARVDLGFRQLAKERTTRKPLRTLVTLPLHRMGRLLGPPPESSLRWIRIPMLGLPRNYGMFPAWNVVMYGLGVLGTLVLWRHASARQWVLVFWIAIVTRLGFHAFAVPHYAGPRYLVEVYPLLISLASVGVSSGLIAGRQAMKRSRLGRRHSQRPPQ